MVDSITFQTHLRECWKCREYPMNLCPIGKAILLKPIE
jgi:hypothetical protein